MLAGCWAHVYRRFKDAAPDHPDAERAFERGPRTLSKRGTREDDQHAFVVESGSYLSARWPGDAYLIAKRLIAALPT